VALVDFGGAEIVRGKPVNTVQRAENLVGIMIDLSPVEWVLFRHGYTTRGVQDAQSTINYIEGSGLPWSMLIADRRYHDAINMILARMKQAFNEEEKIRFNADLGYCYSRLGENSAAVVAYDVALHACTEAGISIKNANHVYFNALKAALRAGNRDRTIALSEELAYAADAEALAGARIVVDSLTDPRIVAEASWCRREIAAFDNSDSDLKRWDMRLQKALQQCQDNRLESLLPLTLRPGDVFSSACKGVILW
jgi:tetratricopeptide (TPR) repeat protein